MANQIQALFQVHDVLQRVAPDGTVEQQIVRLGAVYENNPDHPNYTFWKATPTAQMEMTINNPAAFDTFVRGRKFLLTFDVTEPA
jgi:hypothetical protein